MSENTKLHELIQLFRYNNKHVADLSSVELIEISDLLEQLEKYRAAEEQGRLVILPCKVGDDVYYILGIPNEMPCTIDKCVFGLSDINKIGKTLFLTREKAEAKLKELRGSNE